MEQDVYYRINAYRVSQVLSALLWNDSMSQLARWHSEKMAWGSIQLGHSDLERRLQAIAQTLAFQGAAENVGLNWGYPDPVGQVIQDWLHSPSHRHSIEGHYNLTGVGVIQNQQGEYYFTQIFILSD
jgi:uncharacterized protein YkwD